MNTSICKFTLDLYRNQSQISIPVMQNDTARIFYICLSERGKHYSIVNGCIAMMSIKRPTGTYIEAFCPIEHNAYIKYDFSENTDTAIVIGIHDCQITLFDADGYELSSAKFTMVVHNRSVTSNEIEITDTDRGIIDSIVISEAGRVNAENLRVEAENSRATAENLRVTAETERKTAEEKRADDVKEAIEKCKNAASKLNGSMMFVALLNPTKTQETDESTVYTGTVDKTFAEVLEHLKNGGYAACIHDTGEESFIRITEYNLADTTVSDSNITFKNLAKNKVITFSKYNDDGTENTHTVTMTVYNAAETTTGNSSLPSVTESDNSRIMMVVDGKWEIAQCPVGTQYDMVDVQLTREGWENNENSMYDAVPYIQRVQYDYFNSDEDYPIDVAVKPDFDMMAEAWRCGVFCMRVESQHLVFGASEIPETYIDYHIRITKPFTLSYGLDPTNETLTIYEH